MSRLMLRRRVPSVRQHDVTDCGVACLASIARHHGQPVSLATLRQHAHTDRGGTSIAGMVRAAQHLGYSAKGVRATPESLVRAPVPMVAHLRLPNGAQHYVVVEQADAANVWVMDPAGGQRRREVRGEFDAQWTGVLLLLAKTSEPADTDALPTRRERLWRLMRPHRAALVQALMGTIVYTLLGLAMSVYVQELVDSVLADGRAGMLNVMGLAMVGVILAQTLIGTLRSVVMLGIGQHIDAALILGYYDHLLRLPQGFFDRMRVGELTSRVMDAVKIRTFVADVVVDAVANALVVLASAVMMFAYDWRLAAWTAGLLPLYAGLYAIGSHFNHAQQRLLMERGAALESQMVESLSAVGTVKRFGMERHVCLATEGRFVRLFRTVATSARTSIWIGAGGQAISRLGTVGLLWIGATRALAQQLSAGELMSCYALLGFLTGPALSLVGFSRAVQEARVAGGRLFEIMELNVEERLSPIPLRREDAGDVRLEGVHFRYGTRTPALIDVSLSCRRGEITALVGESGSGKSTIASLVQRLYTVERGRVCIGEHDVSHVALGDLRRLVGVVPQSIDLFSGTVLENITLDDPSPDVARVVQVCTEVGLRDAIERMPQGWMTQVGERGVTLSGGERQRLAIARALYREPAVLLLDEATSALDSTNERIVLEVMHRAARRGTTVIVIAHRLSTVRAADHIVVLARGRVVEEGDHELLVDAGGAYARLWHRQHDAAPPPLRAVG